MPKPKLTTPRPIFYSRTEEKAFNYAIMKSDLSEKVAEVSLLEELKTVKSMKDYLNGNGYENHIMVIMGVDKETFYVRKEDWDAAKMTEAEKDAVLEQWKETL